MSNGSPKRAYGENDLEEFRVRLAELRTWLVPPEARAKYVAYTDGACFGNPRGPGGPVFELEDIVEKPGVAEAPSTLAVAARYVFAPRIFELLERTPPGWNVAS